MSTALAIRSQTAVATQDAPSMSFTDMLAMGNELVRTGFLPDHVKNGAQAAAIILAGRELGMPPMRSLRSIFLVKGKITESADSQLARFKTDGGRAKFTTLDDTRAVLWLKHPNGDEHTESFTMEDAKRAGLVSSGMYSKFSKAMLRSRAITAGLKSVGWEGGAGAYDPDELAPAPAAAEPDDIDDAEVSDVPITDAQRDLLARITKSHVFTDKERRGVAKITTKDRASEAIEWAQNEVKARKDAEKIEAERAAAKARYRERFGDGADGLISEVDKRYDHELERLAELETRKREAAEERERREMAAIEERRNAYANLIADQQRREIEAGERVAKAISEATSRAFSEMTKSLTLDRLVTTMEALNANMEKLTRQRFAMG